MNIAQAQKIFETYVRLQYDDDGRITDGEVQQIEDKSKQLMEALGTYEAKLQFLERADSYLKGASRTSTAQDNKIRSTLEDLVFPDHDAPVSFPSVSKAVAYLQDYIKWQKLDDGSISSGEADQIVAAATAVVQGIETYRGRLSLLEQVDSFLRNNSYTATDLDNRIRGALEDVVFPDGTLPLHIDSVGTALGYFQNMVKWNYKDDGSVSNGERDQIIESSKALLAEFEAYRDRLEFLQGVDSFLRGNSYTATETDNAIRSALEDLVFPDHDEPVRFGSVSRAFDYFRDYFTWQHRDDGQVSSGEVDQIVAMAKAVTEGLRGMDKRVEFFDLVNKFLRNQSMTSTDIDNRIRHVVEEAATEIM